MKKRCSNPRAAGYKNYGGRGIEVCPEWWMSFTTFLRDIGPKPSPELSLDRKENDGNYEPKNCRWATKKEQIDNRRNVHRVMMNGKAMTVPEASRLLGISAVTMRYRIRAGKGMDLVLTPGVLPFRTTSKFLTHNGKTQSVPEWAKELGIRVRTLRERLRRGSPLEKALLIR